MLLLFLCLCFLSTLCIFSCNSVAEVLNIEGTVVIPNAKTPANIPLVLNNGEYRTMTKLGGSFVFDKIPSGRNLETLTNDKCIFNPFFLLLIGIYSLEVYSLTDHFSQLKLKVSADNNTISVIEYKYPGAARIVVPYPITLTALAPILYEIPKPPISIVNMIISNPMMLMMLFSLVMVVGFPMLLKGMSPEELEEIKRQSAANGGDPMKKLSKLMGVQQAGGDDDDEN
jgi:hypothetical protein